MSVEIRVPRFSESVVEATLARWLKLEGATVNAGDELAELETDKANVTVTAESSGVLQQVAYKEGDTVTTNDLLAVVVAQGAAVPVEAIPAVPAEDGAQENGRGKAGATPVAQKLAAESGVDLAAIKGSGPGGKVYKEDVVKAAQQPEPVTPPPPVKVTPPSLPSMTPPTMPSAFLTSALGRREDREPMSRLRQTIADRLVSAQHNAAMLTTFNEVDMSAILEIRKRRKDSFKEKHGVGLGFMSFFTKATVGALRAFPYLNAEIQGKEIIKKYFYDIGIAVGTDKGLVVPVIRDVDKKSFAEIEKGILDLATQARDGKLGIADMMGGTFTITNGGIYGSLMSTPILNPPQVGILGMHKMQDRPIAVNGEVVIRPMMYLALSYDHRLVDGSEAVRFLVRIKELLEDPEALLLEG